MHVTFFKYYLKCTHFTKQLIAGTSKGLQRVLRKPIVYIAY